MRMIYDSSKSHQTAINFKHKCLRSHASRCLLLSSSFKIKIIVRGPLTIEIQVVLFEILGFQMAVAQKRCISNPMFEKPKCI